MSKALEIMKSKLIHHQNMVRINMTSAEEHRLEAEKYEEAIKEHENFLNERAAANVAIDLQKIVGKAGE